MFDQLSARLTAAVKGFRGKGRITEADVDAVVKEGRVCVRAHGRVVAVARWAADDLFTSKASQEVACGM